MREDLYDPTKGMYVPTSHHLYLDGKLPAVSEQLARIDRQYDAGGSFGAALFTNALVIPEGYDLADFDSDKAPAPKLRLTNIGFLIVTVEHDTEDTSEFEEILSWTRGDIDESAFAKVDDELCKLRDYRSRTLPKESTDEPISNACVPRSI
jgi:hypothetical protein